MLETAGLAVGATAVVLLGYYVYTRRKKFFKKNAYSMKHSMHRRKHSRKHYHHEVENHHHDGYYGE